jgi:hypothetical protein
MVQQVINIGAAPDDHTGDPIRTAFGKVNANETELYSLVYSPPAYTSAQLTFGNGTTTLGQDANLTWSATTGLTSKKGISSPGAGLSNELFGLGATASGSGSTVIGKNAADLSTGTSVVVGFGASNGALATSSIVLLGTNTGQGSIIIGNSSNTKTGVVSIGNSNSNSGDNSTIVGATNNGALGTFCNLSGYNNANFAGSNYVTLFGGLNSITNANGSYVSLFGNSNTASPTSATELTVGAFGAGCVVSHVGALALGVVVTSAHDFELAFGGAGLSGITKPVSLRLSGSQVGVESDMTRTNCTWSGTDSVVAISAFHGAAEQIGLTITAGTAVKVSAGGLFLPVQATTAGAPTYVKGAMYFDTTLNKLRIGGATAWETVTSV